MVHGMGENASHDLVSIVEAAYRFDEPDDAWLRRVVEAVAPFVDQGLGVWSFAFDAHSYQRGDLAYEHPTAVGLPADWLDGLRATLAITTKDTRAMFELMFGTPYHTMSAILRQRPKMLRVVQGAIGLPGVKDAIGITARDTSGSAIFIGAHAPHVFQLSAHQTARFGRIAAHIATANRLRRSVRAAGGPLARVMLERAEAILAPRGRVEHATGTATSNAALSMLKRAAVAVDGAVGKLRHRDPDEALRAWEGLVRGRWSLVASFDEAGRRIFLAEPNEPLPAAIDRPLSPREQQIAGYLVLGHSYKLIAYELGLSEGGVSSIVSRLKRKLSAPTYAALVRALTKRTRST